MPAAASRLPEQGFSGKAGLITQSANHVTPALVFQNAFES
jgi:hypothetical protein